MQNSYTTKKLKNKAVSTLNNVVSTDMWPIVTYSNFFVIHYLLILHGSTINVCLMFNSV